MPVFGCKINAAVVDDENTTEDISNGIGSKYIGPKKYNINPKTFALLMIMLVASGILIILGIFSLLVFVFSINPLFAGITGFGCATVTILFILEFGDSIINSFIRRKSEL